MAKHKHRDKERIQTDNNNNGFNNNNTSPFQIDPMNIISMLSGGNLDINSLLSQMNMNGFNMGALSPFAGMDGFNNNSSMNDNMNNNEDETDTIFDGKNEDLTENNLDFDSEYIDDNIDFLVNLKKFVHPDRVKFIDQIIKFYKEGKFKKSK